MTTSGPEPFGGLTTTLLDPELILGSARIVVAAWLLGFAAWRWAPRFLRKGADCVDRTLVAVVLAFVAITGSSAVFGLLGLLGAPALFFFVVACAVAAVLAGGRRAENVARSGLFGDDLRLRAPWALLVVYLGLEAFSALAVAPTNWDAMTYHLYFPERWLESGRIFHVPSVFADPNAAYAPQNGGLIFAWLLALAGRDGLVNVVQVLLVAPMILACARMARELGLARRSSALGWGVLPLAFLPPLRTWAPTANVDVFLLVFFVLAAYGAVACLLERAERGRASPGTLVVAGLASGLAAGTKVLGLPLIAAPMALATAVAAWSSGRSVAARLRDLALLGGAFLLGGGWWYLRNLFLYQNPFFPLDVHLPGIHFRGVYDSETLRTSPFQVDLARWSEGVVLFYGPVGLGLLFLGVAGLLHHGVCGFRGRGGAAGDDREIAKRRAARLASLLLALLAVGWVVYEFAVVPFNNQMRFLLPAFVLGGVGLPRILRPLRGWWLPVLPLSAAVWLWWVGYGGYFDWRQRLLVGSEMLGSPVFHVVAAGLFLAAAWMLWRRCRPARGGAGATVTVLLGVLLASVVFLTTAMAEVTRVAFLAREDYRMGAPGYLFFHQPDLEPLHVAYAGTSLPYTLEGREQRHRVVYVHTTGEQSDGLYETWQPERRLSTYLLPSLHRRDDDPELWLRRLAEEDIDVVALFPMPKLGFPAHGSRDGAFPYERRWIRQHPDRFEPILRTPFAEIHRFVR